MAINVLPRWPNLGYPCLVHRGDARVTRFHALFAGTSDDLGLGVTLQGNLYLQSLSDTRAVQQQDLVLGVAQMGEAANRLIPLRVVKVDKAVASAWSWYDLDFDYAYWVNVEYRARDLEGVRMPQLFNLILDFPDQSYHHVAFHSVYLHDKAWRNFSFAHVADTHLAWRNEEIPFVIKQRCGAAPAKYNNPNQNFRDFIKYANERHRAGELDFVILNGDIVDYEWDNYYGRRPWPDRKSLNNFEYFTEIVKGVACKQQCYVGQDLYTVSSPAGEELEVPMFTTLGNHDFRTNEYPLIFDVDANPLPLPVPVFDLLYIADKVTQDTLLRSLFTYYDPYELTRVEACIYEGGVEVYDDTVAAKFVAASTTISPTYRSLINPDGDYALQLGKHKIICLNTSCDEGIIQNIPDVLLSFFDESKGDSREGSPDSSGFAASQIQFLNEQLQDVEGNAIVVCHAPLINISCSNPPHLMRATEHRKLDGLQAGELWIDLFSQGLMFPTHTNLRDSENCSIPEGWSFDPHPWFKKGGREPYLSKGVVDRRFDEFIDTICQDQAGHKGLLCLSGHTHRSIEYIVRKSGDDVHYYHDQYLDNTLHGKQAQPAYAHPLSQSRGCAKVAAKWWPQHTPLLVQTLSLGPKPAEERPGFLLITIRDDVIAETERVRIEDIRTRSSSQAWYVLMSAAA